jgi:hypothetical protein
MTTSTASGAPADQLEKLSVKETSEEGIEDEGVAESIFKGSVQKNMLMPPTMTKPGLEFSVHLCPKALKRELSRVFPDTEISDNFLAIPTAQCAKMDLVRVGEEVEEEKDALLINVSMQIVGSCS